MLVAGACGSPAPAVIAPTSEPVAAVSSAPPTPEPSVERPWTPPSLDSLREVRASIPSAHAGGRYRARLVASDPGAYLHPDPPYNLEVCEQLREGDDGQVSLVLCARKDREGWRFGVSLPGQAGWHREGALEECVGCHSAGVQGGLLGPLAW